jgi:hypothetical protein
MSNIRSDMTLLNDLVVPINLVFVGGVEAKRLADLYHGTWIENGPTAIADILRCWGISRVAGTKGVK